MTTKTNEINFETLDIKTQKKIQELRKRMAADLGIEIKSKIPIDLYLAFAKAEPMSKINVDGKEIVVSLSLRGRAITILNEIKPNWKNE